MQDKAVHQIERPASLAALVYDRIRDLVLSETFEAGERLTETALCDLLKVSRTPVREALFRLCQDGLVTQSAGRFSVPVPEPRDVREIFALRRLLEPPAVAEVARNCTDDQIERFRKGRDRFLAAGDFPAALKANVTFRRLWRDCIPNNRLRETLNRFDDQIAMVRRATLVNADSRALAEEITCRLVRAFEDRDPDAAEDAMIAFLDAAEIHSERILQNRAGSERTPGKPKRTGEKS